MATVKVLMFGGKEIYSIYSTNHCAVSLDDIATALGLSIGDQLMPKIRELGLDVAVYEVPMVPRGKVQMMMVEETCDLLKALSSEASVRLADWLAGKFSNFDEERFQGLAPTEVRRRRIRDAVLRILQNRPEVTSAEVAKQLEISIDEADQQLKFIKLIEGVIPPSD